MLEAAILYGIVAMLAQGSANAFLKSAANALGALPTVVMRSGISALALLLLFLVIRPEVVLTVDTLLFALAVCILGYFPFMFFVAGLEQGKVGVITPVASGWIVIAAVVSFFLYGEAFSFEKIAALAIVICGVFLASVNLRELKSEHLLSVRSGVPFALLAALLWGLVFPLFKIPSEFFGALFFALLIESVVCLTGCAHSVLVKEKFPSFKTIRRNWFGVFAAGVLTAVFTFCVSLGYLTGEVSIVSALGGSSIVISIILARFLYKERLTPVQYAGAGLVLLGIVFASML